jgi:hypothetical protein
VALKRPKQALVVLLVPDRDPNPAAHRADRESLLQKPVVLGLRLVDRDVEEARARGKRLVAEVS